MGVRIDPIRPGVTRCALIRGEGAVLVDAGVPGKARAFRQALARPRRRLPRGPLRIRR